MRRTLMKVDISHSLERILVKVVDSLGDECSMLLNAPDLHQLDWDIRNFLEEQPLRTAKKATGGGKLERH